jgi:hypothetical protein
MADVLANRIVTRLIFFVGVIFVAWGNFRVCESMFLAWEDFDRTMATKLEMRQIARFIEIDFADSKQIPSGPAAIREKMVTHLRAGGQPVTADTGKDRWGTDYQISELKGTAFVLYSAGPDKKWKSKARDNVSYSTTIVAASRPRQPTEPVVPGKLSNRQWSDYKGRRIVGALKAVSHDSVEILATDGTVVKVPIDRLSAADQAYVHSQK